MRKSFFTKKLINIAIAVIFALLSACAHTSYEQTGSGTGTDPFSQTIAFYRGPLNHLSAVRSGGCPMYPSCSAYSQQAIHEHGMVVGWALAMDRLLRCGRDETQRSPQILINNQLKIYDPLEANDFWMDRE